MAKTKMYSPSNYGKEEEELIKTFRQQRDDAKLFFINCIKPRLDRSYKLYIADNSDRAKEIKRWQANVSVPYIHAVVETLKPRILDARPEFTIQGRTEDDQPSATRLQGLADYTWEITGGDSIAESLVSSALIYGTGFLQVGWKKDVRKNKFLKTKDISKKKYEWEEREEVFYDAPFVDWVDNYSLWYDWHNTNGNSKQFWFKRLVLSEGDIKRRYPMADKDRLKVALEAHSGDLTDYASVRTEVKLAHDKITKGTSVSYGTGDIYKDSTLKMHEVFEWLRPFEDSFSVMVNDIPVLEDGQMPNPYNFKESFFIGVPYLRVPGEYEGYGIPMILENPQIMLNMMKNQRLDAATLNIHNMWIVNPLANINKDDLVARPFGIIYSTDPNGAREIQMADVKPSAYKEEELLKSDMRYSSGVDDFSMGAGGGAASATEVRHLRESTLERVRLFVNHLGEGYSTVLRYWVSMWKQFLTDDMAIRITGNSGEVDFPIIQRDDLMGMFDFKASVIPSIAGQNDVKKKQDMDLFQLLSPMEFIDSEKLTSKILLDWNWNLKSITKEQQAAPPMGPDGMPMQGGQEGMPPEGMPPEGMPMQGSPEPKLSDDVAERVMELLHGSSYKGQGGAKGAYAQLAKPINLSAAQPPTVQGVNPRGLNRGGKVNTNVSQKPTSSTESSILNRVNNIQK